MVVACPLSQKQIDYFESYCKENGLKKVTVWTKSFIETKLYSEHQSLLFKFFGIESESTEQKSLLSKTGKTYQSKEVFTRLDKLFLILIVIGFLTSPIIINIFYEETWDIPNDLAFICRYFKQLSLPNLVVIYLGVIIIIKFISLMFKAYEYDMDTEFLKKSYIDNNIDEKDFILEPERFMQKIIRLSNGCGIIDLNKVDDQLIKKYAYYQILKGMEIISIKGDVIDYFVITRKSPFLQNNRVFFIGMDSTIKQSAKILAQQKFNFCEMRKKILHFTKNDLHIRVTYDEFGIELVSVEIYRGDFDPTVL